MRARPHHLLDIISQIGGGGDFRPHPYGHAVHTVAERVMADPEVLITFVVGADDICDPCVHLVAGRCDDMLTHLDPPRSKQDYNDDLDRRLLAYFGMTEGQQMTFRDYLAIIRAHFEGLEQVCSHPGEDPAARRERLDRGLQHFGV